MGRRSPFTPEQDAHIDSFMNEFEAKIRESDPELGGRTKAIRAWKEATATSIIESEHFKDKLDKSERTPQDWFNAVKKRFENYANRMRKAAQSNPKASADQFFIKLSSGTTGRQLFEQEHKDRINAEAAKRRENAEPNEKHVGFYQAVLKEMWDAEEDKETYDKTAEEGSCDVPKNQADFPKSAWASINALCGNGKLGPAEMMLFYAFRQADGNLKAGIVHGHATSNDVNMKSHYENFRDHMETPWIEYAEHVIPRPLAKDNLEEIPRNAEGVPTFPLVKINEINPQELRAIISEYFKTLWNYTWPSDKQVAAIPWVDISKYPSDYYDTDRFKTPIKLRAPERLSLAELWSLAEFLSSMEVDASLVFRCKEDIEKRSSLREADEELEKEDCDEDLEDTSDNEGLESILQQSMQDASRDTVATNGGDSGPVGDKGGSIDDGITEGNKVVTSTVDWSKDGNSEAGSKVSANEDDSSGDEDSDKASVSETEKHRPRTRSGGKGSGKNVQTKSSRVVVTEDSRMTRSQASRTQRNLRSGGTSSNSKGSSRGVKRQVDHSESNADKHRSRGANPRKRRKTK